MNTSTRSVPDTRREIANFVVEHADELSDVPGVKEYVEVHDRLTKQIAEAKDRQKRLVTAKREYEPLEQRVDKCRRALKDGEAELARLHRPLGEAAFKALLAGDINEQPIFADRLAVHKRVQVLQQECDGLSPGSDAGFVQQTKATAQQLAIKGKIKLEELKFGGLHTKIGREIVEGELDESIRCSTTAQILSQIKEQRDRIAKKSAKLKEATTALTASGKRLSAAVGLASIGSSRDLAAAEKLCVKNVKQHESNLEVAIRGLVDALQQVDANVLPTPLATLLSRLVNARDLHFVGRAEGFRRKGVETAASAKKYWSGLDTRTRSVVSVVAILAAVVALLFWHQVNRSTSPTRDPIASLRHNGADESRAMTTIPRTHGDEAHGGFLSNTSDSNLHAVGSQAALKRFEALVESVIAAPYLPINVSVTLADEIRSGVAIAKTSYEGSGEVFALELLGMGDVDVASNTKRLAKEELESGDQQAFMGSAARLYSLSVFYSQESAAEENWIANYASGSGHAPEVLLRKYRQFKQRKASQFREAYREVAEMGLAALAAQQLSGDDDQVQPPTVLASATTPDAAVVKKHMTPAQLKLGDPVVNSVAVMLVPIPAGEFIIGRSESDRFASSGESPQHPVKITRPFYLSVFEVTQEQYERVMGSRPWQGKWRVQTGPENPAVYVTWNDAAEFCRKLSEQENMEYRLPTEAQWEYACRAGTTTSYSFGDYPSKLGQFAWHSTQIEAQRVGQKLPNSWGLYDMHGNVWEWCFDLYGDYENRSVNDPSGPRSGLQRVLRGGSFNSLPTICRSAYRNHWVPNTRTNDIGFRLSRTYP
jgi:formylglycine-generating enzyme required for sulfatase activity